MLNRGYLNRMPLNRAMNLIDEIYYSAAWRESLNGWARIGADYVITPRLSESLRGSAIGAQGIDYRAAFSEALAGSAGGTTGMITRPALAETLSGQASAGADIYARGISLQEVLSGKAHLGATIACRPSMMETLSGSARLGANAYPKLNLYETLNGYASAFNLEEHTCIITEPIPPGGKLVIDTDNTNMVLNDIENVVHWHRGDWLWIGRPTINLTLSSAGGNVSWEVYYIAQYL